MSKKDSKAKLTSGESKLSKEELLRLVDEWLRWFWRGTMNQEPIHEQAYTQLKEIVEEHFKYDYLRNDPECRSVDEILQEKAQHQKPRVSREWVEDLIEGIEETEFFHDECMDYVSKRLKEIGVSIEE